MKLLEQIQELDFPAPLPDRLLVVEQRFDVPKVADVRAAAIEALESSGIMEKMAPGQTVAIGAGSRGIANLADHGARRRRPAKGRGAEAVRGAGDGQPRRRDG